MKIIHILFGYMDYFSYLCINQLNNIPMDKNARILDAIMKRYVSLSTLKLCMWEDEDTVLVNLADDLNYEIEEEEILRIIKILI